MGTCTEGEVDIIIPTYNRARLLKSAIESVTDQTYKNWRLIVIDDGSTDNTKRVMKELMKKYPGKIEYHYQTNSGPAAARNEGLNRAKGEYIAFLDDDDYWLPEYLEESINFLKRKHTEMVFSKRIYQYKNQFYDHTERTRMLKCMAKKKVGNKEYVLEDSIRRINTCRILATSSIVMTQELKKKGNA